MSISIKPGAESSEHWRAIRAEVLGVALVLAGLLTAMVAAGRDSYVAGGIGLGLAAIGAFLLASVVGSSFTGRSNVKAAAVRRPADRAPVI